MNRTHFKYPSFRQTAGGLGWAIFFILAPMEVLLLGAIVWLPLLVWRERVRANRHGFLPGALCRFGIVAVVVITAVLLPTKHEDQRIGPLPHPDLTLGELTATGAIDPVFNQQHEVVRVSLPSRTPTRREVINAIQQQTGLKASIFHCGSGATILFGGGVGRIRVRGHDKNVSWTPQR
jgi:hypothetical protein